MRIFTFPTHQTKERTSGVDFARVIQPMRELNNKEGFETTIFNIDDPTDWLDVAKHFDAIYFNYINDPWGFAAMGAMARKHGLKIIMDLDDDLWDLHSDNSAQDIYKKGSPALNNFTLICNEVDYITCTNPYLRNVILRYTNKTWDKVVTFANQIDLTLYKHRSPFKNTNQIVLTHFGSTTHFLDLNDDEFFKGVSRIMKEYPNVIFRTVGAFIPKFRQKWGSRYENVFGHQDIYRWIEDKFPAIMDDTDIMVVPLVNDVYNRCKSDIKFLEASSAKKPGVWQKIRQYNETIEDGVDGFLAQSEKEWYRSIKALIDSPELRKNMGEKAFEKVRDTRTIHGNIGEYEDFFSSLDKR